MMRRRERLYIYIIGVILLSACSKSETDRPDNVITFAPVAEKPTKSIISGTTYPQGETFRVSAYHNGTAAYFEGLSAGYSLTQNGTKLWETSEAQYWPLGGALTFYAYSPASAGLTIDATGVSTTGYTVQTVAQRETDLCYATTTVADCSVHPENVPLTFHHALSQVAFCVKAADYYTTATNTVALSLTSLTLSGINSVGNFADGSWSSLATPYTYTLTSSAIALGYDGNHDPVTSDICAYLFLPQELTSSSRITVQYSIVQTISGTPNTYTSAPISIDLSTSLAEWEAGKKYIYTLSIGMDDLITFTATATDWSHAGGGVVVE